MNVHADPYYERLRLSLEDKLFFVHRIPDDVTVFADYGCGDGAVLAAIRRLRPGSLPIGYDTARAAIEGCRENGVTATWDLHHFEDQIAEAHRLGRKVCLNLSSVFHEILAGPPNFATTWSGLRALGCDYIVIRDMAVEADTFRRGPDAKIAEAAYRDPSMAHFLTHGVGEPGTFAHQAELLEGLLKIEYRESWRREYAERYFPLTAEQWHNFTTVGSGYKLRHFEHTPSRYHQIMWRDRLGVDVPDPTHIKLILKKA